MPQPILPPPSSDNTNTRLAPSFYISQLQSQQDEALERATATSRLLPASPFFLSAGDKKVSGAEKSQAIDSQRPSSTPIEHSDLMKLWIPPKRELPFPKPRKSSNSNNRLSPQGSGSPGGCSFDSCQEASTQEEGCTTKSHEYKADRSAGAQRRSSGERDHKRIHP
jgi:hypothetical protein